MNESSNLDRLQELLADEAVFGLSSDEVNERETLANQHPDETALGFETAAAAYYLAAAPLEVESMPLALRGSVSTRLASLTTAADVQSVEDVQPAPIQVKADQPASSNRAPLWLAAMAASLLVGVLLGSRPAGAPPAPATTQQLLAAFSANEAEGLTRVAWTATEDPNAEGATGEVIWSDTKQEGYMTFRGLASNDPTKEQYQLWIFDAERDDRYPVDGGVFNIPADADEVVTKIDPKIMVNRAVMFAITIEKPGGTVVSDRSRLPLLAKVE